MSEGRALDRMESTQKEKIEALGQATVTAAVALQWLGWVRKINPHALIGPQPAQTERNLAVRTLMASPPRTLMARPGACPSPSQSPTSQRPAGPGFTLHAPRGPTTIREGARAAPTTASTVWRAASDQIR